MNKHMYKDILEKNLKKSAEKLGILSTYKFYQDNDPKHKSMLVKEWLLYNCPKVIATPAQSPDLNPIENCWEELNTRMWEVPVKSKEELKRRLQEEWSKITLEYTLKLISSMPKRLRAVIENEGYATISTNLPPYRFSFNFYQ